MKFIVGLTMCFLFLASFVSGAEGARTEDIVGFCQESRDYCEQVTKDFAIETDKQIQLRVDEVKRVVDNEIRMFKFTASLSNFLGLLLALTVHDIFKGRRERKRAMIIKRMRESQGETPHGLPNKNFTIAWFFVFILGVALLVIAVLYAVGYFG